jgi:AcrR family transcriptional regulator
MSSLWLTTGPRRPSPGAAAAYARGIAESKRRPYKKVARAESQQQTREALLDAAEQELSEGRWQKTSLEALSGRAGVTKQTLLRHFGSKDGLIEAAIRRTSEIVRRERGRAPVGDVTGAVQNLLDHYERYGRLMMRLMAEGHMFYLVRKVTDHGRQVHYDWIDHTFAPQLGNLEEQTRARRRAALIALCDVHTWSLLSHDLGLPRPEVAAVLTDLIERLLAEEG